MAEPTQDQGAGDGAARSGAARGGAPHSGARPWEQAWQDALYGPRGFYRRHAPADHFATSTQGFPGGGEVVARLGGGVHDEVDRTVVSLDEVPPHVQNAVVAAEDNLFCEHGGFDWRSLETAAKAYAAGQRSGGGSILSDEPSTCGSFMH